MTDEWTSTSLLLGMSSTRVLVPLLLDEGQVELVAVISSSSDAEETWRSGVILCISLSGFSGLVLETLSLIKTGE